MLLDCGRKLKEAQANTRTACHLRVERPSVWVTRQRYETSALDCVVHLLLITNKLKQYITYHNTESAENCFGFIVQIRSKWLIYTTHAWMHAATHTHFSGTIWLISIFRTCHTSVLPASASSCFFLLFLNFSFYFFKSIQRRRNTRQYTVYSPISEFKYNW